MTTALFLTLLSTASANPFSLDALLDDTAAPPTEVAAPNAQWPLVTHIDQVTQEVKIEWADKPTESVTIQDIIQIELARAWDDEPTELFAVLRDGKRILLSRGAAVQQHVAMMRVWLAKIMVELPVGEGHSTGIAAQTPTPELKLTAAGATMNIGKIESGFRSSQAPVVTGTTPEAKRDGSCVNCIDKRDVDVAVKMRMDKIRGCYQRELRRTPTLAGELLMSFVVQRDGTVGSATVKRSSINNVAVETCVREQFLLMKFAKPPGNQTISVNYPIVFAAG